MANSLVPSSTLLLSAIENKKIRNIIRGILSSENARASRRSMERLRRDSRPSDLEKAYRFLIESPMAKHVALSPIFPNAIEDCTLAPFFDDGRYEAELAAQSARFAASEAELLRAISSIKLINESIFSSDSERLSILLQEHVDDFGISLFLLRKALSIRHTKFGLTKNMNLDSIIDPFMSKRRNILAVAFEDSVDEERGYLRVRRTFLSYALEGKVARSTAPILVDYFSPLKHVYKSRINALQAYSRWGVIDSLAYLERLLAERNSYQSDVRSRSILAVIPQSVHEAWSNAWADFGLEQIVDLLGGDNSFAEYRLFRHSPAWVELPSIANYRSEIEQSSAQRLDGDFPVTRSGEPIVRCNVASVRDLLPNTESQIPELPIDPKTCGTFHRSLALTSTYQPLSVLRISGGKELFELLDSTIDVSLLFSVEELNRLLPARPSDLLYEYLRTALHHDAEECRVNDHAFRRATQNIVARDFNNNIVEFVTFLDEGTSHVAEHFHGICNEYFLTELYLLFGTSDDVIEAQAQLLEWYGKTRDDDDAVTRAKSHRLNLRLRKVRGTIDDTRIYVDQLKFQYWAIDVIAAQLRDLTLYGAISIEGEKSYPDLSDPILAVENPRAKLFQVLNAAYHEFCSNKFYGVDSYIGRRIRHGTLKGVLVAELRETVDEIAAQFRFSSPAFSAYVDQWHKKVEDLVRVFGNDLLRVRSSDRKKGLIIPSLEDSEKRGFSQNMFDAVSKALENDRSISTAISHIYNYCWILLEVDLKRLRAAAEAMRQDLVIRPNYHVSGGNTEIDAQILDATRRLNTELQQRFENLSSWLTRPSNVSPSATLSLLFHAVINEVQGRYQGFYPKITEEGETSIDIFGHRFHTFYDALFVLVDNAAKHGKRGGDIKFRVQSVKLSGADTEIQMEVISQFGSGSESKCRVAIERAMKSDLGDAMVEDKDSGLRKVRTLVEEVEELTNFCANLTDKTATFRLIMQLPLSSLETAQEAVP